MDVSYELDRVPNEPGRLFNILFKNLDIQARQFPEVFGGATPTLMETTNWRSDKEIGGLIPVDFAHRLAQDRADIDISGPEFNFVRSIRVFDVRFATQREAGEGNECRRSALVYLGTYGKQGNFSWAVSAPASLPDAHVGLEGWGLNCPSLYSRSVFVDWRDYKGNYGFEQVNY